MENDQVHILFLVRKRFLQYLKNQTPYVKTQRNFKVLFQIMKEGRLLSFIISVKSHKDCMIFCNLPVKKRTVMYKF